MIKEKFDRILLPLQLSLNHYVVVEMRLTVFPDVKVWDGTCQRGDGQQWQSPFLASFMQIMYSTGWFRWHKVPVRVERDTHDPNQPATGEDGLPTKCSGPMAALTLANLAMGVRPAGYDHDDDATIRAWMLASMENKGLVALPQLRKG